MKYIFFYQTKIGRIGIVENDNAVSNVYFPDEIVPSGMELKETELIKRAGEEINEYFSGKRSNFDIPLAPEGTEFQKSVWNVLKKIPYGKTFSYKQVAEAVGNPKASRAVGMANNRNPIPLFIPCHRVIGADGSLTGYRGGLEVKKKLLDLEKDK
jgi:methylated-DNA-[protein]-cysteine S-methyltransferase